jgi:hypothetical protein
MTDEDMTTAEFAAPAPSTTDSVPTAAASETAASQGSEVNPKEPASERADDAGELSSQEPVATRSLTVVLRALGRHHSRALMLERLAYVAMEEFLGIEGRPPTKLLKLPNGAKFTVESDDALELNMELSRMALEERSSCSRSRPPVFTSTRPQSTSWRGPLLPASQARPVNAWSTILGTKLHRRRWRRKGA